MKASLFLPKPFAAQENSVIEVYGIEAQVGLAPCVATTRSIETIFVDHADFVFRTCRCLGLEQAAAEDATQQVFMVAARKISQIPEGKERAFVLLTAKNVVANARRAQMRRREDFTEVEGVDERPGPDEMLDRARARAVMDRMLEEMDLDLRTAFVLFEVEQLSFTEIAELLAIPRGTVASRVRRAREHFEARVVRAFGSAPHSGREETR